MKKIISILLVLAVCFSLAACGLSKSSTNLTTVDGIDGITIQIPSEIDLSKADVEKGNSSFYCMTEDGLLIIARPINAGRPLQSIYEDSNNVLEETVEFGFGVNNASINGKSLVNLSTQKVSAPVKATAGEFGVMSGHVVFLEKGTRLIGVIALASGDYIQAVGEKTAKNTTKSIVNSFAFAD